MKRDFFWITHKHIKIFIILNSGLTHLISAIQKLSKRAYLSKQYPQDTVRGRGRRDTPYNLACSAGK
jgi:hypothetical protein